MGKGIYPPSGKAIARQRQNSDGRRTSERATALVSCGGLTVRATS